jgi:hypothetical protein
MAEQRSSVGNQAGGWLPARRSGRRAAGWWAGALSCAALLACERAPDDSSAAAADPGMQVLARIGDDVIRAYELGGGTTPENVRRRLDFLVERKLAAMEARHRGYDTGEKLRTKLADIRRNAIHREEGLLRDALYNSLRTSMVLSEDDLRAHYEAEIHRFTQRQWKLRFQRFASQAEARAADEALGADGRLDPANSESVGPLPVEKLPAEFRLLTDSLRKPGQRKLIAHAKVFTLVELEEFLPAAKVPFEEVREWVDKDLRATRATELLKAEIERMRAQVKVTIDEQALAELTAPTTEAAPPAGSP